MSTRCQLATWAILLLCACSADPSKNPEHTSHCKPGTPYHGFCVFAADGGSLLKGDGGAPLDASKPDAGETCSPADEGAFCYLPGPGYDLATRSAGVCRAGTKHCVDGHLASCLGQIVPSPELCDGLDNDCDGKTDEDVLSQTCSPDASTNNGTCDPACMPGELCCAGKCINPQIDAQNCNGCGMACGMDIACCGAVCTNTVTDELHCGSCNMVCGGNDTCCGGGCADLNTDPNNCGACGHGCPTASPSCCKGTCVDTTSDAMNCKTCGNTCLTLVGLIGSCSGSKCAL